jgi:hypothetical protein
MFIFLGPNSKSSDIIDASAAEPHHQIRIYDQFSLTTQNLRNHKVSSRVLVHLSLCVYYALEDVGFAYEKLNLILVRLLNTTLAS